ncbi:hypothetical protein [Halioxenophilus aromaticivorans]|uniref:Uncharacterized protein n=1 Tax=Halioxenophilus aromaticivorans TaxID=1306992 RepID=A0AAV3U0M8_9ALTE
MQLKRRNLLKGVLASAAAPLTATAADRKLSNNARVVKLRPGYYSVDGWVVNEQELTQLRKDGLC